MGLFLVVRLHFKLRQTECQTLFINLPKYILYTYPAYTGKMEKLPNYIGTSPPMLGEREFTTLQK